jgi:hypothetical protein
MKQVRTDFVAKRGGVMTDEVGTVTGDLTLLTEVDDDGTVRVFVQYVGAEEWYRVTDSPTALPEGETVQALHDELIRKMSGA